MSEIANTLRELLKAGVTDKGKVLKLVVKKCRCHEGSVRKAIANDPEFKKTFVYEPEAFAKRPDKGLDSRIEAIVLKDTMRVSNRKPSDDVKAAIYALQKGKGYPVDSLSMRWNLSIETVKKHAKRFKCLRYVEISPGEWMQCVLHPETAQELTED